MLKNYYEILQISPNASAKIIHSAWRTLMKETHPDAGGSAQLMRDITDAYEVLIDPDAREAYDGELYHSQSAINLHPELSCPHCGRLTSKQLQNCHHCGYSLVKKREPPSPERLYKLGLFLFERGMHRRALSEFEAAARLNDDNALYHYWAGRCLYQLNLFEKARSSFYRAHLLKPKQFQFMFWLGQSLYCLERFEEALQYFKTVLKLKPDYQGGRLKVCTCLFKLRNYAEAMTVLEAMLSKEQRAEYLVWLGLCQNATGNHALARKTFSDASSRFPQHPLVKKYSHQFSS